MEWNCEAKACCIWTTSNMAKGHECRREDRKAEYIYCHKLEIQKGRQSLNLDGTTRAHNIMIINFRPLS